MVDGLVFYKVVTMRKILSSSLISLVAAVSANAADLSRDTSDPLFLQARSELLSQTGLDYFETGLRIGQSLSYGLADRFIFGAKLYYQLDFEGDKDDRQTGFSSIDLGGVYRMGTASENKEHLIYDLLVGLKLGGSHRVRTPEFADSTYYVGLRLGHQYDGVTFAATLKSSWIFDDAPYGMAFIDLTPEVYFRVTDAWRFGANLNLRKATNSDYNEESIGAKLVREYGRTQYVGHVEYEFENKNISVGVSVNILF